MKLSIVATLYQSAEYIAEFYRRASAAARQLVGEDYEIVFVNDGSPDNSVELAAQLTESDDHVVVVDLARNFGHHKAMMAGLQQSSGDKIFLIDSDLEEEPEWLMTFSERMAAEKADVVYGVQSRRKGNWFEQFSGYLFYSLFNLLSNIDHPRNLVTARLMSRRYVNALLRHGERELVISCLWVITGFKQCAHPIKKHQTSKSTYGFFKKLNHLVNAVTSFSEAPLKMIFFCGIAVLLAACTYASWLVVNRFFMARHIDGWTSIMVSVWILGGLIISFIGVIGIYLAKVFSETKQRPYVIVREVYGKPKL
ncbi:glycosyltransferase [Herbaspirillum lusitanum]|uniref:glycosyltransferase family 2 protein n=1 Tax=Herbaspirillum lusitanum TaxID=213312 RepID=UPI0022377E41|nr:glycosyltransferase family 2 protein [Herbaspirillum lusitanum]MCW5299437.1 glycosyltransferase [Herbaspirillum lusitanum]